MEEKIREKIIEQLKTVYDPEIPVDIWELGLVYEIKVFSDSSVSVIMTLTSPMCPVADSLPAEVEEKISGVEGVASVNLDLTFDPPWEPSMMSEVAKFALDFYP
jgi:FeS assembly SUF system protein